MTPPHRASQRGVPRLAPLHDRPSPPTTSPRAQGTYIQLPVGRRCGIIICQPCVPVIEPTWPLVLPAKRKSAAGGAPTAHGHAAFVQPPLRRNRRPRRLERRASPFQPTRPRRFLRRASPFQPAEPRRVDRRASTPPAAGPAASSGVRADRAGTARRILRGACPPNVTPNAEASSPHRPGPLRDQRRPTEPRPSRRVRAGAYIARRKCRPTQSRFRKVRNYGGAMSGSTVVGAPKMIGGRAGG